MEFNFVNESAYDGCQMFVGDIHNHCGISYGHGSIEEAFTNARLQLDFASVTGHAWWHDMPHDDPRLGHVVRYHEQGFERLAGCWDHVQDVTGAFHEEGSFVTFLSFEWHSLTYGDHCVYYRGDRGPILRAMSLEDLHDDLRRLRSAGTPTFAIPHHIAYRKGWRGINWQSFRSEFSPVVEIMSMHGCGESDQAPHPYLHTMGPRDIESTAQQGLRLGNRFGFIGSTDHHSAHPGSHGHGRVAVWARELTREAIWEALASRRTYALTGDRILLATSLNGFPMGSAVPASESRHIEVNVVGGDAIDTVEIVRNGRVLHRTTPSLSGESVGRFSGLLGFSVGWGEVGIPQDWDVTLEVVGGRLLDVEPRLRGEDVLAPLDHEPDGFSFSQWERAGPTRVRLRTRTRGNPTTSTDSTQGLALRIDGDLSTRLTARVNNVTAEYTIGELLDGTRTGYLEGFLSGAFQFHRAVRDADRTLEFALVDERPLNNEDWYYVRVRQMNGQWAWCSPIWVERRPVDA